MISPFAREQNRQTLLSGIGFFLVLFGTWPKRSLRESSSPSHSRPHSRPDPDTEQEDREDDEAHQVKEGIPDVRPVLEEALLHGFAPGLELSGDVSAAGSSVRS